MRKLSHESHLLVRSIGSGPLSPFYGLVYYSIFFCHKQSNILRNFFYESYFSNFAIFFKNMILSIIETQMSTNNYVYSGINIIYLKKNFWTSILHR